MLDRFDDYWNTDRPLAVGQFVVKIILDEATIVQALTTGEVDGVFGTALSGKSVQALQGVDTVSVYRAPSYQVHYLTINTGKPPWDDPRVRQAISMAIDKNGIAAVHLGRDRAGRRSSRPRPPRCGPTSRMRSRPPGTRCPSTTSTSRPPRR